jgi:hypothetical protein
VFPVSNARLYAWKVGLNDDQLFARYITKAIAMWMIEALPLPALGMPIDAFKLPFNHDFIRDKTSEVFNVLQRDAAWQTALDLSYTRQLLLTPTWFERRLRVGYIFESFPQALQQLVIKNSSIGCHFTLGTDCDPEVILNEHGSSTLRQWEKTWDQNTPRKFQESLPLPPWHILRADYAVPKSA